MRAILWDLDDTLLDTIGGRMRALAYAYECCLGCKTDPGALWRSHRGGTLEELGRRLLGPDARRFATVYRDRYYATRELVKSYPGVVRVLGTLHHSGIAHAVVTSKVAWGATEELSHAGLLEYIQAVVGCDDTDEHKPDPEPIYEAMRRLCIDDPAQVLFVGDSPADIWAAHNAGCRSIAALWGTLDASFLLDAMPDFEAKRPEDVLEIARRAEVT